jgi:hypothetical protein
MDLDEGNALCQQLTGDDAALCLYFSGLDGPGTCSIPCEDDQDCPPSPGEAPARCIQPGQNKFCALDCSMAACPPGLQCFAQFQACAGIP